MMLPSLYPSTSSPSSSGKGAVEAAGLKADRNMAAGDKEMLPFWSKLGKMGDRGGRPSYCSGEDEDGLLWVLSAARSCCDTFWSLSERSKV